MTTHPTNRLCLAMIYSLISFLARGAVAAEDERPEPMEPRVVEASNEAAESMVGIHVRDDWAIQLFAAEPEVANIVALDVDHRGRVFVCESFRQNQGVTDNRHHDQRWLLADLASQTVEDRIDYHRRLLGDAVITYSKQEDRLRRLEDTDGDGKIDRSVVVADGFNGLEEGTGAGVLVRGDDIYYACIPKLWKFLDSDDDGEADERAVLSDGYGVRVAYRGHDLHGLVMGPDGRLYFSMGDRGYHVTTDDGRLLADPDSGAVFRCEMDGTGLEVYATGLRNPQELAFNDLGDLFSVDNNSDSGDKARIIHILEGGDSGWRMHYQYLPDRGPFNRENIWKPFHHEQPAYLVPPVANLADGPSGLAYYPGSGFGKQLKETFLICDFRGSPAQSGIRSFRLAPNGAFYQLIEDSKPIWNVLATDVTFGPDGAIYFSDWVDGWGGLGKGRVYRVTSPDSGDRSVVVEVKQLLESDWTSRTVAQLSVDLGHVDRRVRLETQWELARRCEAEVLVAIANDFNVKWIARLHAIWGADQIARCDDPKRSQVLNSLRRLLHDDVATIRAAAAKVAGERADAKAASELREMLSDESARVRYFAAISLGNLRDTTSFSAIVKLLAANDNSDPAIRHAGVRFFSRLDDPTKVVRLASHANESVRRAAVVALRRLQSHDLTKFLSDPSPLVVLEAARAIYDLPIPCALESLAALIEEESDQTELTRRVLNANYRLGTAEAAAKLAEFSGRASASVAMRIEALSLLEDWSDPDPRDRVINAYRPLKSRPADDASEAISSQIDGLMASEESVREKVIIVAAALGVRKIIPLLIQHIDDTDLNPTIRATAIRALARLDEKRAVSFARKVDVFQATKLVATALSVLAEFDGKGSLPKFIEATQSQNMEVRQIGWDILAENDQPEATATIGCGVEAYLDGTLPADVQLNVLEAANGKIDDKLRESLHEHDRILAEADALAPWLISLEGGIASKGRKLFFEKTELSCVRCHQVDRVGGSVGPILNSVGKAKDRRYLLESICLPDAQITKGFETTVIANDSGQVFAGIVNSDNQDYVELLQNDGSLKRIPTDEIEVRRKGKSSMPEGLAKFMTARELRDLVAYLASLQFDPNTDEKSE